MQKSQNKALKFPNHEDDTYIILFWQILSKIFKIYFFLIQLTYLSQMSQKDNIKIFTKELVKFLNKSIK